MGSIDLRAQNPNVFPKKSEILWPTVIVRWLPTWQLFIEKLLSTRQKQRTTPKQTKNDKNSTT